MKRFYSLFLIVLAFVAFGAYQTVNVGTNPNDGTGDTLRSAFQKVNANFTQVTADFVSATNRPGYGLWLTNYQSGVYLTNSRISYPQFGNVYAIDGRNMLVNNEVILQTSVGPSYNAIAIPGTVNISGDPDMPSTLPLLSLTAGSDVSPVEGSFMQGINTNGDILFEVERYGSLWINPTNSNPFWKEGRVFYDSTEKTLSYYNENNNMTVNVGQETIIRADNKSGANIPELSAVYVSGSHGHNPEISLAVATNELKSSIIGVTTTWVTNNSTGYVTTEGLIHNVNTKAIGEEGATVFISTNVPGGLTTNDCTTPFHSVSIGIIAYSHVTQGILFVHPQIRHVNVSNIVGNASSTLAASNFVHTTWKWVDVLVSGTAVASNPSGDPPVLTQIPGSNYFGYAYYADSGTAGDRSYFSIQSPHKFASTNAANPNMYFEPHLHVSVTNITSGTESNATFRIDMNYGVVNGFLTNYFVKTNTVNFTNAYFHSVLDFGNVTNNALSGRSSVIFRGRIMRINGGVTDLGNSNPVWVDSLDIHVPIQELGTVGQFGD